MLSGLGNLGANRPKPFTVAYLGSYMSTGSPAVVVDVGAPDPTKELVLVAGKTDTVGFNIAAWGIGTAGQVGAVQATTYTGTQEFWGCILAPVPGLSGSQTIFVTFGDPAFTSCLGIWSMINRPGRGSPNFSTGGYTGGGTASSRAISTCVVPQRGAIFGGIIVNINTSITLNGGSTDIDAQANEDVNRAAVFHRNPTTDLQQTPTDTWAWSTAQFNSCGHWSFR